MRGPCVLFYGTKYLYVKTGCWDIQKIILYCVLVKAGKKPQLLINILTIIYMHHIIIHIDKHLYHKMNTINYLYKLYKKPTEVIKKWNHIKNTFLFLGH